MIFLIFLIFVVCDCVPCRIMSASGGGAHGVFQVGVLQQLMEEKNITYDVITGVSSGSINSGYISLFNESDQHIAIENLRKLWFNLTNGDVYKRNWNPISAKSLYSNNPLNYTLFKNIIKTNGKAKRPIIVGTTNFNTGKIELFYQKDFKDHMTSVNIILSSTSIPVYFAPHYMNNKYYVDGGLSSDELIQPAIKYCKEKGKTDIIIDVIMCSMDPKYMTNNEIELDTIFGITYRSYSIISNTFLNHEIYTTCKTQQKYEYYYPMNIYRPYKPFPGGLLDFSKDKLIETYWIGYNTQPIKYKYCY